MTASASRMRRTSLEPSTRTPFFRSLRRFRSAKANRFRCGSRPRWSATITCGAGRAAAACSRRCMACRSGVQQLTKGAAEHLPVPHHRGGNRPVRPHAHAGLDAPRGHRTRTRRPVSLGLSRSQRCARARGRPGATLLEGLRGTASHFFPMRIFHVPRTLRCT